MSTPVNIIIDNKTVLDDVVLCQMDFTEGSFCNSVNIEFGSQSFWALCDPTINFGTLRIKVVIGDDTYQFLCEERDSVSTPAGIGFSVWGRSKQALLATPYSQSINDTENTSHPWQTGRTTADAVVSYVVSNYCPYSVTVNWNVEDFAIYADSFAVSNQSPIDVISALANVIGAELKAHINGSLSIETYSVAEGTSVAEYNDLDEIVALNEKIIYPSGYNAVTIYGYDSDQPAAEGGEDGTSVNSYISVESESDETTCLNAEHPVRVYYYHPRLGQNPPLCSFPDGSSGSKGTGTESITEDVTLIWGVGHTSKPNIKGVTEVTGHTSIPFITTSVTYSIRYKRFYLRHSEAGSHQALFYFSDESAYSTYSFTVTDCSDDEDTDFCSSIVIEQEDGTAVPGGSVYVRIYGAYRPNTIWCSGGNTPKFIVNEPAEEKTENIVFTNGSASLSYPLKYYTGTIMESSITDISFPTHDTAFRGLSAKILERPGSKDLTINEFIDHSDIKYYYVPAAVTYETSYYRYRIDIPDTYDSSSFTVVFSFADCSTQTLDITVSSVDEDLYKDITITVKDYATDANLQSVSVWIDGSFRGNTNSDGLSVSNIRVGDHTIKFTRPGYIDSDLDDLSNDTFTVS